MVFVKILLSIISVGLFGLGINLIFIGNPLIVFGISGILLSISLWGKFKTLFIISIIALVISIITFIIYLIRKRENSLKKAFTMETLSQLGEDLLKNAHYFIDEELKMVKVDTKSENTSESGRMVSKSSSLENQVIITTETKGKLLSIDDNEIRIQFDAQEDCSLSFKFKKDGFYLNADEDKVIYNKNEYTVDCKPMVLYKLVRLNSYKTIKNKAKGAW